MHVLHHTWLLDVRFVVQVEAAAHENALHSISVSSLAASQEYCQEQASLYPGAAACIVLLWISRQCACIIARPGCEPGDKDIQDDQCLQATVPTNLPELELGQQQLRSLSAEGAVST